MKDRLEKLAKQSGSKAPMLEVRRKQKSLCLCKTQALDADKLSEVSFISPFLPLSTLPYNRFDSLSMLQVQKLDVSSLASIREFAKRWADSGRKLDCLINNAGILSILGEL